MCKSNEMCAYYWLSNFSAIHDVLISMKCTEQKIILTRRK